MSPAAQKLIDSIIDQETFRRNVYNMVPEGCTRVLDFGCGAGALLLRLMRDKGCTELYGIDVQPAHTGRLNELVTQVWHLDIEKDDAPLADYQGFFNCIILHDVVEHLYDPWFTLTKIRKLLSPHGKIIVATPNIHYWQLQHELMSGRFPYGPGLWHTGHLRWYTPISLVELLLMGGLTIEKLSLEIPHKVDLGWLAKARSITSVQLPPGDIQESHPDKQIYTVSYDTDIKRYYPVFYAHKIIAECTKGELLIKPQPMTYSCQTVAALRKAMNLPYDLSSPPAMTPLIGNWN